MRFLVGVCGLLAVLSACQGVTPPLKQFVINNCKIIVEPEGMASGTAPNLGEFEVELAAQKSGREWFSLKPSSPLLFGDVRLDGQARVTVDDWNAPCVSVELNGKKHKATVKGHGRLTLKHPAFTVFFHETTEAANAVAMYLYKDKHVLRILITPPPRT
jgi:hypothetical protein